MEDFLNVQRIFLTHQTKCIEQNGGLIIQMVGPGGDEEPPPWEPGEGDLCAFCWGEYKTFGEGPTPRQVRMTGSGFEGDCAVFNNTFILTQQIFAPCEWFFEDDDYYMSWSLAFNFTLFFMTRKGEDPCFERTGWKCVTHSQDGDKVVDVSW